MKIRRALLLLAASACLFIGGCATLDALKETYSYNHETGKLEVERQGAEPGGQYNENTGLNMTWGDNSVPALIIVGILGAGVVFTYPIQRSLRLRKERELKSHWNGEK